MSEWLLNLPVLWMAVVVFAANYLLTAGIYWVVTRLAVNDRAKAFKAISPGMLPPLGIRHQATFSSLRAMHLIELLHDTLTLKPADDSQRMAQPEMMRAIHTALDARRQRIVVSQSAVGTVKWAGILLQAVCTLIAIAMVHSDNRLSCAIAMTLFATGVALSLLLIAAYSRPFTGEISVRPDLLKQVMTSGGTP